jgi:hypothetical protein
MEVRTGGKNLPPKSFHGSYLVSMSSATRSGMGQLGSSGKESRPDPGVVLTQVPAGRPELAARQKGLDELERGRFRAAVARLRREVQVPLEADPRCGGQTMNGTCAEILRGESNL